MKQGLPLFALFLFSSRLAAQDLAVPGLTPEDLRQRVIKHAMTYLGVPYLYGGTTRRGMDSSGLVWVTYRAVAGVTLPRTIRGQAELGVSRTLDQAQPGDIMIFDTLGGPTHAGIYLGDRTFVHAAIGLQNQVIVNSMDEPYYRARFLYARCVIASIIRPSSSVPIPQPPATDEIPVHPLGVTVGTRLLIQRDRIPFLTGTRAEFILTNWGEADDFEVLLFEGDFEGGRYSLLLPLMRQRLERGKPAIQEPITIGKPGQGYGAAVRTLAGELRALYVFRSTTETP